MRAYVEHIAITVQDLEWHLRFFRDVFGMEIRMEKFEPVKQVWVYGGIQFIDGTSAEAEGEILSHVGIMTEAYDEVLAKAYTYDVEELPQGHNWLKLPGGLCVEVLAAGNEAVK